MSAALSGSRAVPDFPRIPMPMFFQIFTPMAPWSNALPQTRYRSRSEVAVFKPARVKRGGPGNASLGCTMHFDRATNHLVEIGRLVTDSSRHADTQASPVLFF